MDPKLTIVTESNGVLKLLLQDTHLCLANAIRRTLLSDIQCVVFRTFPDDQSKCIINKNKTSFNNEIIKQRLSCIPIHIKNTKLPLDHYEVIIKKINNTSTIQYLTSEDFAVMNTAVGKLVSKEDRDKIFPPDPQTNQFIDFIRLKPPLSSNVEGEEIDMKCAFSVGTAKENGMFNVVSTCAYAFTRDETKANEAWQLKERELQSKDADIETEKNNWFLLEANRYFIENSYDFIVESVGVYTNIELIQIACTLLVERLGQIKELLIAGNLEITVSLTSLQHGYDIKLVNEDYTLGKVLEYLLHENYFKGDKTLSFCGFVKEHPHDNYSIIRIGFKEPTEMLTISAYMQNAIEQSAQLFQKIAAQIK